VEKSPREGKARNYLALPAPTSTGLCSAHAENLAVTTISSVQETSQLKEAGPVLSKMESSSTASFGPPEQHGQRKEPFPGLRHKNHVWKQQHVGEESPCLQICWMTETGHGNLGAIRNTMACRKEG